MGPDAAAIKRDCLLMNIYLPKLAEETGEKILKTEAKS
jgi:hypothetical protein